MRLRFTAIAVIAGVLVLPACSSGHPKARPSPTTTEPSSAPTGTEPSTGGSATSSSTTPTPAKYTTTTRPAASASNVKITSYNYVGDAPVSCNAPTLAELKWTTSGATNVEMRVDNGPVLARYPNGSHDELLPLDCDGKSHTYELKATAPGVDVTRSITISTKRT